MGCAFPFLVACRQEGVKQRRSKESFPCRRGNCATSDQTVRYNRRASWEDSFPIWFYGRAGAARTGQRQLSNRSWRAHQTNEGNAFERSARGNEKPPPQR